MINEHVCLPFNEINSIHSPLLKRLVRKMLSDGVLPETIKNSVT